MSSAQSGPAGPAETCKFPATNLQLDSAGQGAGNAHQQHLFIPSSSFQKLLVIFGCLCGESHSLSGEIFEDFVLLKQWEQGLTQPNISIATRFVQSLPHVDLRIISVDKPPLCMICEQSFAPCNMRFPGPVHHRNSARALPCGHLFCCECIVQYIEPHQQTPKDKCPSCHAILFVDWMRFHYLARSPSPIIPSGWVDMDSASKIQMFWDVAQQTRNEYNEDFKSWLADPRARFTATVYETRYEPNFATSNAATSSEDVIPAIVVHRRAQKELQSRSTILQYMQDFVRWSLDPSTVRPTIGPSVVSDLFKLRREQEWDSTRYHEAAGKRRGAMATAGNN